MRVRLKQPAELVVDPPIGRHVFPAGTECDIPDDHFDPSLHEDLTPPAAAEPSPAAPSPEGAEPATAAAPEEKTDG